MQFLEFAQFLQKLEAISSRLEITQVLSSMYQALEPAEIPPASYLMLGSLVPPYEPLEFQLSTKMVIRSLARISAVREQLATREKTVGEAQNLFGEEEAGSLEHTLTNLYKKKGDVGLVTEELLATNAPTHRLSVLEVYTQLATIAKDNGQGSQERKVIGLADLLEKLDATAAKFVVRIIIGRLRLGFSTMTMLDALSWAVVGDKSHHDLLEKAYQKKADVGELAKAYVAAGKGQAQSALEKYTVQVGIPVVPALCQRLNSSEEIIAKMGQVMAEPKYDGLRAQVHIDKKSKVIKSFTRNLEDASHMFPELQNVAKELRCESCILDAEVIGVNSQTGEHLTFQETITRKRKHEVEAISAKIPVKFYVFDLLELNGEALLPKPLSERKKLLRSIFDDSSLLQMTPTVSTDDPQVLKKFHEEQLGVGLEGVVAKKADSAYLPGRKGWSWVKIKEAEGTSGKLSDTLDVVVMGYYAGRGKRSQFGIGAFLVGVLDEVSQSVKTIAKIGTGLSDEQFTELKKRCDALAVAQKPSQYEVAKGLMPEVWTKPELVVEVAADEITKSPNHTAGVALRFPRLVKFREDKNWDDATTLAELEAL